MSGFAREIHSSLQYLYLAGGNYAVFSVPWIAVATSVIFAVSPIQTINQIQQAKNTLNFSFSPYFFYLLQSVMFFLYAVATGNHLLKFTTGLGCLLGSYYVKIFYKFAKDKETPKVLLSSAAIICSILSWIVIYRSTREAKFVIGVPGNLVMILTAASPLSAMKNIIRTKDASCLPVGMSIMNVVAGLVWAFYGYLLGDILVFFPNFVGFIMGMIQISLIYLYPPHLVSSKKKDKVLYA